jgi:hypothetical protein
LWLQLRGDGARRWTVHFDDHAAYLKNQDSLKREQLAKAGARLAELLNMIWPRDVRYIR